MANTLGFSQPSFPWLIYQQTRPQYPPSLFRSLYDYHTLHNNAFSSSWGLAVDMGAGHGVVSAELAEKFSKVIVCEPNEEYLNVARQRLQKNGDKYIFYQRNGEDIFLDPGTADMIVWAESIHWTDPLKALSANATHMKKGGTLCVVYYSRPRLEGQAVSDVWEDLCDFVVGKLLDSGALEAESVDGRAWRLENSGMDGLQLSERDWRNVRRVKIGVGRKAEGRSGFEFSRRYWKERAKSEVQSCEAVEEVGFCDHRDWRICGVDAEWLMRCLKGYCAGMKLFDDDKEEKQWVQKLKRGLEECGGVADAVHTASIIFASKR